ncbi:ribonuclease H [marine gamma proteobacterium HTCC2080]|jgi:ribonuclease HI|nr:ribonuclease H [marine gamma proteobacterium HTCC2080]
MKVVEAFTDGACKGNPGPGGWGVLLRMDNQSREIFGGDGATTNNRMELTAAIEALAALKEACTVELTTDSTYVKDGVTRWMENWERNGWRTAAKKPVKNQDLWQALKAQVARHEVNWHWVKGHSGHPENELADMLANKGIAELQR